MPFTLAAPIGFAKFDDLTNMTSLAGFISSLGISKLLKTPFVNLSITFYILDLAMFLL